MGHIIDTSPWGDEAEASTPAQTGCINCLTICPWTSETEPPLTSELGRMWYEAHQKICLGADWAVTWRKN